MWQIYHDGNNGVIIVEEYFDSETEAEERLEYLDEEHGYSSFGVMLKIKEMRL